MMKVSKLFGLFAFFVFSFVFVKSVDAAPLQRTIVRYDRMKVSTPTNVQVILVPATIGTENKVKVTFAAGTVVGAGVSVTTTNLYGATALPGTLTIASSGQDVTISGVSDLSVGVSYGFNISVGISTPSGAGQVYDTVTTQTAANATIDSTRVASRFVTDDQMIITGTVPPIFNFVLSGNTDTFTGDLDSAAIVSTLGKNLTVTTNANKGWIGWVKSTTGTLSSVTTGESIGTTGTVDGSPSTCAIGTDCYVLDVGTSTTGTGTGSLTVDPEYAGNGTTSGGTLVTSLTPFVTRTGKTNGDTLNLKAHVSIIGTKAAASDYTDTWTIIGAGNF